MRLSEKQQKFTVMIAQLILHARELGYGITFGHGTICEDCRVHHQNSLHRMRLAQDLNLFKDGEWLTKTEDHRPLGEYWESLGGTWGGRFDDGNHYSLEHNGMK